MLIAQNALKLAPALKLDTRVTTFTANGGIRVILVNMEISVILGHEKTKIQNIIDLEMIDVFSVKTIIHSNNKKMGHLI